MLIMYNKSAGMERGMVRAIFEVLSLPSLGTAQEN
jgi:hypothetical protein